MRLKLEWRPVAIAFMAAPPADLPRVDRPCRPAVPIGSTPPRDAVSTQQPEDHYGCTVGALHAQRDAA